MASEIKIPYRGRDDDLSDVIAWTRHLEDPEDQAVARQVAVDAVLEDGLHTSGELIDKLGAMSRSDRHELLNRARVENGLPTVEDVVAHQRFAEANEAARIRGARRRQLQACAVCGRPPTGPGGMPAEVPPVKRYHCPEHEHLAAPGDLDPPQLPVDLNFRFVDPDEAAREQREDEKRLAEAQRRSEDRAAEREAIRLARERYEAATADDDYLNPEIAGFRGGPRIRWR